MNPGAFKSGLDQMLRDYAREHPNMMQPDSPYAWIGREKPWEQPPAPVVLIPLYHMRDLPPPFRMAEQDREAASQ